MAMPRSCGSHAFSEMPKHNGHRPSQFARNLGWSTIDARRIGIATRE
jgi:hypothetical protein